MNEYGLFNTILSAVPAKDKKEKLYQLLSSSDISYTSSLYLYEHMKQPVLEKLQTLSEEEKAAFLNQLSQKEKFEQGMRPATLLVDKKVFTKFSNPVSNVSFLKKGIDTVYESSLRCAYQKDNFIKKYGEDNYKEPLNTYLIGKAVNSDCDGFTSITIDFDSNFVHSGNRSILMDYVQALNTYTLNFLEFLPKDLEPTSIRFTGTGFQFVYQLKEIYYFNKKDNENQKEFVKATISWLRKVLEYLHQEFFEDLGSSMLPKGVSFELDKVFENNLAQMRRVPGSFNSKTNLRCAYIYLANNLAKAKHSLGDLIEYCKENYRDLLAPVKRNFKKKSSKNFTKEEAVQFCKSRMASLEKIIENRYTTKTLVGSRHLFITQLSNCVADLFKHQSSGQEEPAFEAVFKETLSLNQKIFKKVALKFSEVKSAVKASMKRREKLIKRGDSTNLGNKTIASFVQLTEEEENVLRETSSKAKAASTKVKNQFEKNERIKYAYALYQEEITLEEIGQALNMSTTTAHRYVSKAYKTLIQEEKNEEKVKRTKEKSVRAIYYSSLYHEVYEKVTSFLLVKKFKQELYATYLKTVSKTILPALVDAFSLALKEVFLTYKLNLEQLQKLRTWLVQAFSIPFSKSLQQATQSFSRSALYKVVYQELSSIFSLFLPSSVIVS